MPNTTADKISKNLKKPARPRTVPETVLKVSSHVSITQSTPSLSVPPTSISTDGSVMGPDLSQIPSKELDSFIQNHLRPSPQFQQQVRQAIDSILRCLREKCEHKVSRVSKVSPMVKVPLGCPQGTTVGRGATELRCPGKLDVLVGVVCWLGVDQKVVLPLKVELHPNPSWPYCKSKLRL